MKYKKKLLFIYKLAIVCINRSIWDQYSLLYNPIVAFALTVNSFYQFPKISYGRSLDWSTVARPIVFNLMKGCRVIPMAAFEIDHFQITSVLKTYG